MLLACESVQKYQHRIPQPDFILSDTKNFETNNNLAEITKRMCKLYVKRGNMSDSVWKWIKLGLINVFPRLVPRKAQNPQEHSIKKCHKYETSAS